MRAIFSAGICLWLALWPGMLGAQTAEPDYHALFEARCMGCHGHAADFARETLQLTPEGAVVGSDGRPLAAFLSRHKGGLPPEQIERLLAMFARQIEAQALFRNRCSTCHDRAREFTRLDLILRDGALWGRYSGRPVASFLPGHARLTAEEAAEMTRMLAEILKGAR